MSVKVIPNTEAYREGWERTFGKKKRFGVFSDGPGYETGTPVKAGDVVQIYPSPDTVRLCGPAVWPFDAQGRLMDFSVTDRELIDTVAY